MISDGVEFHNIAELREVAGRAGRRLQRVPEAVRVALNERAQDRTLAMTGSEIRFVSEGDAVTVTLSCPEGALELIPFFGPFQVNQRHKIGPEPTEVTISRPARFAHFTDGFGSDMPFSPNVWRLTLRGQAQFHGIEGKGLRPPTADELPKRRYLSYGTSITHGSAATAGHLTYVGQTAWRLGADLINLGVGGSCHCEKEFADYIAGLDWDIASLSLSVNMIGGGFTDEEFEARTAYFVDKVAGSNPDRPVACITIYPHFRDFAPESPDLPGRSDRFREIYRGVVNGCGHANVHLIEGPDLLKDIGGLTVDLIHPGDLGMIQMGELLAKRMEGMLG